MPEHVGYLLYREKTHLVRSAEARLREAGATRIVVEYLAGSTPAKEVESPFEPLFKQPELIKLVTSMKAGDTLLTTNLYSCVPAIFRLIALARALASRKIDFVSLDDHLDTRRQDRATFVATVEALAHLVRAFEDDHGGSTIHIMEGNGGGGGEFVPQPRPKPPIGSGAGHKPAH